MNNRKKPIFVEEMFGKNISEITAHNAMPEGYKKIKFEDIGRIFGVNSTKIIALKEVTSLGKTLIELNEDENMRFPIRENLSSVPAEFTEASKKYIGNEKLAYSAALHANKANVKELEEFYNEIGKTLTAMKQTILVQQVKVEEFEITEERENSNY